MALNLNINTSTTSPLRGAGDYSPAKANSQGLAAQAAKNSTASNPLRPAAIVTTSVSSAKKAENTSNDQTSSKSKDVSSNNQSNNNKTPLQTIKRFVFEHDDQSGLSVVKFMDSKGNVIFQVPPEQYLKSIQLIRSMGGLSAQNESQGTNSASDTGMLLSKKV